PGVVGQKVCFLTEAGLVRKMMGRHLDPSECCTMKKMRTCLLLACCGVAISSLAVAAGDSPKADANPAKIVEKQDLVYGRVDGAGLLADVAYPEGDGPFPAIISVHGGRWRAGHRNDASSIKVREWAEKGFFAMSIDYRLVTCTPAPACYQDMLCAIRWVNANAKEYHIDTDRIYLIGQSAGGDLVSFSATASRGPFKRTGGWDTVKPEFRAAISVAGPYELNSLDWGNIWTPPGANVEEARKLASPMTHVSDKIKPLLIIHADNDRSVPIQQAVDMAA